MYDIVYEEELIWQEKSYLKENNLKLCNVGISLFKKLKHNLHVYNNPEVSISCLENHYSLEILKRAFYECIQNM